MVERTVSVRTRGGQIKEWVFTSLNAANFDPTAKTIKRPNTARRLSAAHAALSHSDWEQQKGQAARNCLPNGAKPASTMQHGRPSTPPR